MGGLGLEREVGEKGRVDRDFPIGSGRKWEDRECEGRWEKREGRIGISL